MLPNVGAQELLIIFVVALVIVGPRKLPELGRALGRGLSEFRKIQDEVRDMVKFDLSDDHPTFDLGEDPVESTPRPPPAELGPGSETPEEPEVDEDEAPEPALKEMTHSERVVALAAEDRIVEEPAPESAAADPAPTSDVTVAGSDSPWIYDVMDDDEPVVEHPPASSAE